MITDRERQSALDLLNKTRQAFLDAVDGLSDSQARWKPAPDRWSILEYAEHLALADDALVSLVKKSLLTPPLRETEEERRARETKIRETPVPRGVNRAPEGLQPTSRFASLADAVGAFLAARERTLEYTRTTEADLRSHFHPHPVFGALDAYQWLAGNGRHVATHCEHIKEIRQMDGFPPA